MSTGAHEMPTSEKTIKIRKLREDLIPGLPEIIIDPQSKTGLGHDFWVLSKHNYAVRRINNIAQGR